MKNFLNILLLPYYLFAIKIDDGSPKVWDDDFVENETTGSETDD